MTNETEHRDACGLTIQERINQALTETLPDIGQIDKPTKAALSRLVKQGLLSKGKGGPFPALKTVYAVAGFDFDADRKQHVDEAMRYAEWESRHGYSERGKCLNLDCSHGKGVRL